MPTDAPTLAHSHLRTLLTDAEATRAEAERLRADLSETQLTWRPALEVWSVADCFEHLRKTDKAYCGRIDEAIGRMGADGAAAFRPSWFGKRFLRFISPESSLKLKAPKSIRPTRGGPSAPVTALDGFLSQQRDVLRLIRQADGKDLNSGSFPSPLLGLLRFSVGEGLTLLVWHEQRHLGQALRLTERPDFPDA